MQVADASVAYDSKGNSRQLPLSVENAVMIFSDENHLDINAGAHWMSTIPRGNGWVLLGPNKTAYAVAMYHQLHCLNIMRYDLTVSKAGIAADQTTLNHAHHCYNYLRQSILCKADGTLEPSRQIVLSDGRIGSAASGSGVTHVCRNWAQIRRYMEDNFDNNVDYEFWKTTTL